MPKPTPKKVEGSKIISPEEFMGGAVATNAEQGRVVRTSEPEPVKKEETVQAPPTPKPKSRKKTERAAKEPVIFVGVRIPESVAEMLEEYDQNYALRGESKNAIMAEGIKKEIASRLKKAKGN